MLIKVQVGKVSREVEVDEKNVTRKYIKQMTDLLSKQASNKYSTEVEKKGKKKAPK